MEKGIKSNLEELRKYLANLSVDNLEEFNELIESIKNDLPGSYKDKFSALKFYEIFENQDFLDDLPF